MIKLENEQGKFEFDTVQDLRDFLEPPKLTEHDFKNFGYLISNLKEETKGIDNLIVKMSEGSKVLKVLSDMGMKSAINYVVRD